MNEKITISIDEFRNLLHVNDPERVEKKIFYGNFAIGKEVQEKQCENLKIGDTVFYLRVSPVDTSVRKDGIPEINVVLTQATVVE